MSPTIRERLDHLEREIQRAQSDAAGNVALARRIARALEDPALPQEAKDAIRDILERAAARRDRGSSDHV